MNGQSKTSLNKSTEFVWNIPPLNSKTRRGSKSYKEVFELPSDVALAHSGGVEDDDFFLHAVGVVAVLVDDFGLLGSGQEL